MSTSPPSAEALLRCLREGPQSAQDLAGRLAIDSTSVRRHLDVFTERGWVATEDRVQGRGRPRRYYALTSEGRETFPRDYGLLLKVFLREAEKRMGREQVLASFSAIASELAPRLPDDAAPPERLDALERFYTDLGFEADVERDHEHPRLVQRNCPFMKTAEEDPDALCTCLDQGIIKQTCPGASVTLLSCMATGDTLCTHEIRSAPARVTAEATVVVDPARPAERADAPERRRTRRDTRKERRDHP